MYHALEQLDDYLSDNPQQYMHCMSPDSEYVVLVAYSFTLSIDMCNFPNIWAVLSILLDTVDRQLQYIQDLQYIYNKHYETCTDEAMEQLEQQCIEI